MSFVDPTPSEVEKLRELVGRASGAVAPLPEKVLADSARCGAGEAELLRLAEIGRRAEELFREPLSESYRDSVYASQGSYTAAAWAWFRAYLMDGES